MLINGLKRREDLCPGDTISYPYLWDWQRERGAGEAEKLRPCVVMLRTESPDGIPLIALLPLTTQPIRDYRTRVIVPVEERRRLGLSLTRPQSVSLIDCNIERLDETSVIHAMMPVKAFGERYTSELTARFRVVFESRRAALVMRRHTSVELEPRI